MKYSLHMKVFLWDEHNIYIYIYTHTHYSKYKSSFTQNIYEKIDNWKISIIEEKLP